MAVETARRRLYLNPKAVADRNAGERYGGIPVKLLSVQRHSNGLKSGINADSRETL